MNSGLLIRRTTCQSSRMRPMLRSISSRLFSSFHTSQRHWHQAACSTSVVLGQHHSDHRYENNNSIRDSWWLAAAAGALGFTTLSATTSLAAACEEEQPKNTEEKEAEDDEAKKWEIGPDDPYYNIPEEDEPTDCSMCLTFRQGPCRLDWKRFELCVKDNSPKTTKENGGDGDGDGAVVEDDHDPTACMKYAMPFYNCSSKHVNGYLIIGTHQTQKSVIEPLMDTYDAEEAKSRRVCYTNNSLLVDWTHWEKFVTTLYDLGGRVPTKFDLNKTKFDSAADALKATWADKDGNEYLMMNDEGEPFLITVTVQVPKPAPGEKEEGNSDLFMTFALDQHGNLMGDARNKDDDEDDDEDKKQQQPATHLDLQLQVIPGVCQEFTVYGLYAPKDGDFLTDGVLYESKPYSLEKITKKATKKAKKLAKQKSNKIVEG